MKIPASRRRWSDGAIARMSWRRPRLHHAVPQLDPARTVAQVDLVADLARPARARHDDRDAVQVACPAEVVPEVRHRVAEQRADHVLRPRALHLKRRDVWLPQPHVQSREGRDAQAVQERVRVGEREPEVLLPQPQQDRVVHDAAGRCDDRRVLALHHVAAREVPARDQLREPRSVGAGDLDLTFDRHVPERHAVHQGPVLGLVVVVQRRDQHVVVEIPAGTAGLDRALPVRRASVPRRRIEPEGVGLVHHANLLRPRLRSRLISRTQLWAGIPVTPPPAWVALEHWYRPRIGVR